MRDCSVARSLRPDRRYESGSEGLARHTVVGAERLRPLGFARGDSGLVFLKGSGGNRHLHTSDELAGASRRIVLYALVEGRPGQQRALDANRKLADALKRFELAQAVRLACSEH